MTDWHTMETAPKDGTRILAFRLGAEHVAIAHWEKAPVEGLCPEWQWRILDIEDFIDDESWKEDWCTTQYDPTHWMLIPSPPPNNLPKIRIPTLTG